jgi:hypothetical protein
MSPGQTLVTANCDLIDTSARTACGDFAARQNARAELAAAIDAAVREAVAAERERCAGIVAGWGVNAPVPEWGRIQRDLLREIREGGAA